MEIVSVVVSFGLKMLGVGGDPDVFFVPSFNITYSSSTVDSELVYCDNTLGAT